MPRSLQVPALAIASTTRTIYSNGAHVRDHSTTKEQDKEQYLPIIETLPIMSSLFDDLDLNRSRLWWVRKAPIINQWAKRKGGKCCLWYEMTETRKLKPKTCLALKRKQRIFLKWTSDAEVFFMMLWDTLHHRMYYFRYPVINLTLQSYTGRSHLQE